MTRYAFANTDDEKALILYRLHSCRISGGLVQSFSK